MNAPVSPAFQRKLTALALVLASATAVAETVPGITVPPPAIPGPSEAARTNAQPAAPLNPGSQWVSIIVAGKTAQEGDADLAAAAAHFSSITDIFEQLRTPGAEALFRLADVQVKLGRVSDGRASFERFTQWFPDFTEYVDRLRERFQGSGTRYRENMSQRLGGPGIPGRNSMEGPHRYAMDPELLKRYGLQPPPSGSSADAADTRQQPPFQLRLSRELAARYGLPLQPGGTENEGNHRASSPEPLLPSDSGLAGTIPSSPGLGTVPSIPLRELEQTRLELLDYSRKIASDLRRNRMAIARVHGRDPSSIPPQLVDDPRLQQLIEGVSEPLGINEEGRRMRSEALVKYFNGVYMPRLATAVEILEREHEQIRAELKSVDKQMEELAGSGK